MKTFRANKMRTKLKEFIEEPQLIVPRVLVEEPRAV